MSLQQIITQMKRDENARNPSAVPQTDQKTPPPRKVVSLEERKRLARQKAIVKQEQATDETPNNVQNDGAPLGDDPVQPDQDDATAQESSKNKRRTWRPAIDEDSPPTDQHNPSKATNDLDDDDEEDKPERRSKRLRQMTKLKKKYILSDSEDDTKGITIKLKKPVLDKSKLEPAPVRKEGTFIPKKKGGGTDPGKAISSLLIESMKPAQPLTTAIGTKSTPSLPVQASSVSAPPSTKPSNQTIVGDALRGRGPQAHGGGPLTSPVASAGTSNNWQPQFPSTTNYEQSQQQMQNPFNEKERRILQSLENLCSKLEDDQSFQIRAGAPIDLSGSFLHGERYDFFDLDDNGEILIPAKIPIFPEDFPPGVPQWPLSWWGIVEPDPVPRPSSAPKWGMEPNNTKGPGDPRMERNTDQPSSFHPPPQYPFRPDGGGRGNWGRGRGGWDGRGGGRGPPSRGPPFPPGRGRLSPQFPPGGPRPGPDRIPSDADRRQQTAPPPPPPVNRSPRR